MFNHQIRPDIIGRPSWRFSMGVSVAVALTVALGASTARAQDCQSDADCGFGFRCHQEVISTTSSSVSGASSTVGTTGSPTEPECGNSFCEETEDPDSCPDDCGITSYCVGVSCESDSECAEDYSCQPEGGIYSTTTTGSDGPVCGDYACDDAESEESCWTDCNTATTCQVTRCATDADCNEGFYCDPRGGSAVSSATTSGGGTDGSSYTIELYLSECLPLPTDGSGGNGSGVSGSSVQTASTGDATGGTDSDGGGHWPHWPPKPHPGCSVAAAPSSGSPFLAALVGLFACGLVQRRRRNE